MKGDTHCSFFFSTEDFETISVQTNSIQQSIVFIVYTYIVQSCARFVNIRFLFVTPTKDMTLELYMQNNET